jgi:hypothetical protein
MSDPSATMDRCREIDDVTRRLNGQSSADVANDVRKQLHRALDVWISARASYDYNPSFEGIRRIREANANYTYMLEIVKGGR